LDEVTDEVEVRLQAYDEFNSEITDSIYASGTAEQKIVAITCTQGADECGEPVEVDVEDIEPDEDGVIHVFNHGINQEEEDMINTAKEQTHAFVDGEGTVYAPVNPHTGSMISEVLYAGYDKTNEFFGGILPLTNASKANIEISHHASEVGAEISSDNHSRGSLTYANGTQRQLNDGETDLPINEVVFNGAAASAQAMVNRLYDATNGEGVMLQSRHKSDVIVAGLIGFNGSTGGKPQWMPWQWMGDAHGAYGPNVDIKTQQDIWYEVGNNAPVVVEPNR